MVRSGRASSQKHEAVMSFPPDQVVLKSRADFCPLPRKGHLLVSGDICDCHDCGGQSGAAGVSWVGARVLLNTTHRTAPTTETCPAAHVHSANTENPWGPPRPSLWLPAPFRTELSLLVETPEASHPGPDRLPGRPPPRPRCPILSPPWTP